MTSIANSEPGLSVRLKLNRLLGVTVNAQVGTTYTLTADDENKLITLDNPDPITLLVPSGLGAGYSVEIVQLGEGLVTVVEAGAEVNAVNDIYELPGRYGTAKLRAYAADTFLMTVPGTGEAPPEGVILERSTLFEGVGTMTATRPASVINRTTTFAGVGSLIAGGLPVSSAGVFDSTGKLVRTLWSAETNDPRVSSPVAAWDGTVTTYPAGTVQIAPTGSYTIKVIRHNMQVQWDGTVGNTSPNHLNNMYYHNEGAAICDMCITTAGEMYYVTGYNERWPVVHVTTTANPQVMDYPISVGFRTAYEAQYRCCTDDILAYFQYTAGPTSSGIYAIKIADKTRWPFSSGVIYGNFNNVIGINSVNRDITGLAVQKTGSYLFACSSSLDYVKVYDKTTGAELKSYSTWNAPTHLAANPTVSTQVWLAYSPGGTLVDTIAKLSVDGSGNLAVVTTITVTGGNIPHLAVSPDGATLLAIDQTTHQVRAFNTSDGSVKTAFGSSGTFGVAGGYAASPTVTNTKFMFKPGSHFGGTMGYIAFASDGSWWLGDSGNERSLHFSSGNSPTYLEQVAYNGGFYSTEIDRTDPTRVTVNYLEYQINYAQPTLTPTNGSWTLLNNWGYSFDIADATYFTRMKALGTYSNGRRYATVYDSALGADKVWELTATGMRHTGSSFPRSHYIDADFNANRIYFTGSSAADWRIKVDRLPFTGFDGSGNPTWGTNTNIFTSAVIDLAKFTVPQGDPNFKNQTEPTSNGVLPIFQTVSDETGGNVYGRVGGIDMTTGQIRYNTAQVAPAHQANQLTLMYPDSPFIGICGLGGGFNARAPGHNNFFTTFRGEEWGNNQTSVFDHWHESGLLLQRFGSVAPYFAAGSLTFPQGHVEVPTTGGATVGNPSRDMSFKGMSGLAGNMGWGNVAFVNNVYYLYVNDEWYHGLQRWSVRGIGTVVVNEYPVSWNSASYTPPSDPNDLLLGLPYASTNLPSTSGGWIRTPTSNVGPWPPVFWEVKTNCFIADPHKSPDLTVYFAGGGVSPYIVSKTIPRVGSGNWSIDSKVFFVSGSAGVSIFFEILDSTNKTILSVNSQVLGPSNNGLYVNGTKISTETGFSQDWNTIAEAPRPLIVTAQVGLGTMNVSYNGTVVATGLPPMDGLALIGNVAKFQIRCFGPASAGGSPVLGVTRLRYSEP